MESNKCCGKEEKRSKVKRVESTEYVCVVLSSVARIGLIERVVFTQSRGGGESHAYLKGEHSYRHNSQRSAPWGNDLEGLRRTWARVLEVEWMQVRVEGMSSKS